MRLDSILFFPQEKPCASFYIIIIIPIVTFWRANKRSTGIKEKM